LGEIDGTIMRSNGAKNEYVFSAENIPVDIQKIKLIHRTTGNQY
jgi:hypothetical protein